MTNGTSAPNTRVYCAMQLPSIGIDCHRPVPPTSSDCQRKAHRPGVRPRSSPSRHKWLVSQPAASSCPVPPTLTDRYRFPWRRKESPRNRPFSCWTSGTESSNPLRSANQSISFCISRRIARAPRRAQMDDVAQIARVSKNTVYDYFESKEALFYLIIDRGFSRGADAVGERNRSLSHFGTSRLL